MTETPYRLYDPERDELPYRRLGGTAIAAILGYSRWETPLQKWAYCLRKTLIEMNEPMRLGNQLEPMVAREFAKAMGLRLEGPFRFSHVRDDRPWAGASPDRALANGEAHEWGDAWLPVWDAGWDGKTTGYLGDDWGEEGSDEVPADVLFQCHGYLYFFDAASWFVSVLAGGYGGLRIRHYRVDRDHGMDSWIEEEATRFWRDHILTGIPPWPKPEDGSFLPSLFPASQEALVEPDEDLVELVDMWKHQKEVEKRAKKEKEALAVELKARIGTSKGIRGLVTWSRPEPKMSFDWRGALEEGAIPEEVVARFQKAGKQTNRLNAVKGK